MDGLYDYEHGISALDAGIVRPCFDAIHMVVEGDRVALVDTATQQAVPRVLKALQAKGLTVEQVDYVMLTHVHLDHAGGAGALMNVLPNARLTVHPRGVRHMIDPSRLWEGTVAVYGEAQARRMYGTLMPVPQDRIIETPDGAEVKLLDRVFLFLDSPGHARHHVCIVDRRSNGIFTGDTFGLSYRDLDCHGRQFVFPSTTPVQFDPIALRASIERLLTFAPKEIYVTHFGRVTEVPHMAADLLRLVDAHVELAHREKEGVGDRHFRLRRALIELLHAESKRQNWQVSDARLLELFETDIELNAQGLGVWLDRDKT